MKIIVRVHWTYISEYEIDAPDEIETLMENGQMEAAYSLCAKADSEHCENFTPEEIKSPLFCSDLFFAIPETDDCGEDVIFTLKKD